MRVVNHQITLRLHKEQNSSNVLETSLVVNQYYNLIRTLRKDKVPLKVETIMQ